MKKFLFFLLLLTQFYVIKAQESSLSWNFPINKDSPEWASLKTYSDKLNAYNIPQNIIGTMSTKELVKSCLSYPEFRLIMTRNSYQEGYEYLKTIFNGFTELEKRVDAGNELFKSYCLLDPKNITSFLTLEDQGGYIFKFIYIEVLLAQSPIITNISDKKALNAKLIENYKGRSSLIKYFGDPGQVGSILVLARILDFDQRKDFLSLKSSDNLISVFVKQGYFSLDKSKMDEIIQISEKSIIR